MGPLFGKWMTTKWQKLPKTFFKQKKNKDFDDNFDVTDLMPDYECPEYN